MGALLECHVLDLAHASGPRLVVVGQSFGASSTSWAALVPDTFEDCTSEKGFDDFRGWYSDAIDDVITFAIAMEDRGMLAKDAAVWAHSLLKTTRNRRLRFFFELV